MKHLDFHFDPISPYAYLAFERLPQALEGLSFEVDYRPLLLAGLLQHWGTKGPAEVEPKRAWTYRQIGWLAHRHGIAIDVPAQHPFNPLALLRLALACAPAGGTPNRRSCELLFHHVWRGGHDANDPQRLDALRKTLRLQRDPGSDEVKQELKAATAQAAARGVFGVPTIAVDDKLFWGLDALEMVASYLRGDAWFDGPDWAAAAAMPQGLQRAG
jgi:2-hydroxychromene-2-carboxylate isomerase